MMTFSILILAGITAGSAPPFSATPAHQAVGDSMPCVIAKTDSAALADTTRLTICSRGGQRFAHIPRALLQNDFVLRTWPVGNAGDNHMRPSGALRLRHVRDSLELSEYIGTDFPPVRYQRRATAAILYASGDAVLMPIEPLWMALRRTNDAKQLTDSTNISLYVLRLPAHPMQPRFCDYRVLYSCKGPYIERWRLEKKDPSAPVSDVVQPIILRIANGVPARWRPYISECVDQWRAVFDAIGLRHALLLRSATDTTASEHDVVVEVKTAGGGGNTDLSVDPRTGEILGGMVTVWSPSDLWEPLFAGELDPRTLRRARLPDSLVMRKTQDTFLHEFGHAFGLEHNFKASGVYPADSLRSRAFVRRMGSAASVMTYQTGNDVAQPEDSVSFADRRYRIGPYDRWVIAWGYRPIPSAHSADAERPTLERWRAVQDTSPYLQIWMESPTGLPMLLSTTDVFDPTLQYDLLGDDPLTAAKDKLRNITQVALRLDPQQDTDVHLRPKAITGRWEFVMEQAENIIGGMIAVPPYPADPTRLPHRPVDSALQVQTMRFLLAHTFYGEDELVSRLVLGGVPPRRSPSLVLFDSIAPGWNVHQWREYQTHRLTDLVQRLSLPEGSATQRGVHAALCQELAGLRDRLASVVTTATTAHAKQLQTMLMAAFASDGVCRLLHGTPD